jgi:phosphomannomutase
MLAIVGHTGAGKTTIIRLSTNSLKTALCEGLLGCGVDVADVGNLPTPAVYFAGRLYGAEAVLIVTASHNLAHDNGLKIMIGQRPPTEDDLAHIRRRTESGDFRSSRGTLDNRDPRVAYEDSLLSRWKALDPSEIPHLVLDPGQRGAFARRSGRFSQARPRL